MPSVQKRIIPEDQSLKPSKYYKQSMHNGKTPRQTSMQKKRVNGKREKGETQDAQMCAKRRSLLRMPAQKIKYFGIKKALSKKVLEEGLEPSLHAKLDPKSSASANSATRANQTTAALRKHRRYIVVTYFKKERKCQSIFQESNEPTKL